MCFFLLWSTCWILFLTYTGWIFTVRSQSCLRTKFWILVFIKGQDYSDCCTIIRGSIAYRSLTLKVLFFTKFLRMFNFSDRRVFFFFCIFQEPVYAIVKDWFFLLGINFLGFSRCYVNWNYNFFVFFNQQVIITITYRYCLRISDHR